MTAPIEKRTICADGAKIVELRRARGWSQQKLADEAELQDKRTISSAERGRPVYLQTIRAIAAALEVAVAALLKGESGPVVQTCLDILQSPPNAPASSNLTDSLKGNPFLLPAFKDGEILEAAALNNLVEAVVLLERNYQLESPSVSLFHGDEILTAAPLNAIMGRIGRVRQAAGFTDAWVHFPVSEKKPFEAAALNELSANVNEMLRSASRSAIKVQENSSAANAGCSTESSAAIDLATAVRKVNEAASYFSHRFGYGKRDVDILFNAVICGEPLILLTLHGQGISTSLGFLLDCLSLQMFSYHVFPDTTPEEMMKHIPVLGSVSGVDAEDSGAQNKGVLLIDEVEHLCSPVANMLMDALSSSRHSARNLLFRANARSMETIHIATIADVIATKIILDPSAHVRLDSILVSQPDVPSREKTAVASLSLDELNCFSRMVDQVDLQPIADCLRLVIQASQAAGIIITDRLLRQVKKLMAVSAIRRGALVVSSEDLWCLEYLGGNAEEHVKLRAIVASHAAV